MHKDWTVCDWKRVLFSDETRISHLGFNGVSWCWICNEKTLPTHAIKKIVKHGEVQ
jgi:hypothetical protein